MVTLDDGTFPGRRLSNLTFSNNFTINNSFSAGSAFDNGGMTLTLSGVIADGTEVAAAGSAASRSWGRARPS